MERFEYDDILRMVDVEDRHAVDRAARVAACSRVRHVVRADHERDVGLFERGVDLVHLVQLVVGHVRLRQEHVHVARHAPGHRVNGVADVHAFLVELVGQLTYGVLRLGDREAVSGNDHDAL